MVLDSDIQSTGIRDRSLRENVRRLTERVYALEECRGRCGGSLP